MTIEDLQACDPLGTGTRTDAAAALKRKLEKLNRTHVRALFTSRKPAFSTSMIMVVWGLIGSPRAHHPFIGSLLTTFKSGTRIPPVQRIPTLHPSHARREIPRWQHFHNVSQLTHHCRARRPRSTTRRHTRRNPSLRSQRHTGALHHSYRGFPVRNNDSQDKQCIAGLELCV